MSKVQLNIEVDAELLEKYSEFVRVAETTINESIVNSMKRTVMGHENIADIFRECAEEVNKAS